MNLVPNIQTLINQSQSYFETPTEENGKLILTLRYDVIKDPDNYRAFLNFFNPLKKSLRLEQYIEQKFVMKPTRVPTIDYDLPICQRIEYHIDTVALHVDRLRDFFQHGVTKADVAESLDFLKKNGWTEQQFQSEIGVSRSSYFRYVSKKEVKNEPLSISNN